jgi:putative tryptophan/tyrosine transport system substrate-binding protein
VVSKNIGATAMIKTILFWLLTTILLSTSPSAEAQQPTKIPRIGYLIATSSSYTPRTEEFRQGLREFGYVEGKNIVIEYRYAEGKFDHVRTLAAELVA